MTMLLVIVVAIIVLVLLAYVTGRAIGMGLIDSFAYLMKRSMNDGEQNKAAGGRRRNG